MGFCCCKIHDSTEVGLPGREDVASLIRPENMTGDPTPTIDPEPQFSVSHSLVIAKFKKNSPTLSAQLHLPSHFNFLYSL
jgi:hypothetical protein